MRAIIRASYAPWLPEDGGGGGAGCGGAGGAGGAGAGGAGATGVPWEGAGTTRGLDLAREARVVAGGRGLAAAAGAAGVVVLGVVVLALLVVGVAVIGTVPLWVDGVGVPLATATVGVEVADRGSGAAVGAGDPQSARTGARSRRATADRPRTVDRGMVRGRFGTSGRKEWGMGDCPLGVGSSLETNP